MTARQVDSLLDERARLVAKNVGLEAALWHAEVLLKRVGTLLPKLITASPFDAVDRDTLVQEIAEFISEPRHHPTISTLPDGAAGQHGSNEGTVRQGGTTLADEVKAGLHDEPHP